MPVQIGGGGTRSFREGDGHSSKRSDGAEAAPAGEATTLPGKIESMRKYSKFQISVDSSTRIIDSKGTGWPGLLRAPYGNYPQHWGDGMHDSDGHGLRDEPSNNAG